MDGDNEVWPQGRTPQGRSRGCGNVACISAFACNARTRTRANPGRRLGVTKSVISAQGYSTQSGSTCPLDRGSLGCTAGIQQGRPAGRRPGWEHHRCHRCHLHYRRRHWVRHRCRHRHWERRRCHRHHWEHRHFRRTRLHLPYRPRPMFLRHRCQHRRPHRHCHLHRHYRPFPSREDSNPPGASLCQDKAYSVRTRGSRTP